MQSNDGKIVRQGGQGEVVQRSFWSGPGVDDLRCTALSAGAVNKTRRNIVLVHGGAHTSECWVRTPDGRPGWADQFLAAGHDVYLVDWIDTARPLSLVDQRPQQVIEAPGRLLRRIGPSTVVGHSLGGGLVIKATEAAGEVVQAVVLLAPAAVEFPNTSPAAGVDGRPVVVSAEVARDRFANSSLFPRESFSAYVKSLVPYGPLMRNAAIGVTPEFRIDPARTEVWRRVRTLVLLAEEDRTVPLSSSLAAARAMGVALTMLGADWGLPGHGHVFIVERRSEIVATHTAEWLSGVEGP